MKKEFENFPSEKYRLMIYFATSTLLFYSKDCIYTEGMSIDEFRQANPEIIGVVYNDGIKYFNYELSYEQMSRAINAFILCKYYPLSNEKKNDIVSNTNAERIKASIEEDKFIRENFDYLAVKINNDENIITINLQESLLIHKGKSPIFNITGGMQMLFNVGCIINHGNSYLDLETILIKFYPEWNFKRKIILFFVKLFSKNHVDYDPFDEDLKSH